MPRLDRLLLGLDFDDTDIVGATLKQPKLFLQACDYRIAKMRSRRIAESKLALLKAELSLAKRANAAKHGDRLTEGNLAEWLTQDPDFRKATRALAQAQEMEEHAKLLVEAYRQRRDVCRIIADISRSDEYGNSRRDMVAEQATAMVAMRKKLAQRYPGGEG